MASFATYYQAFKAPPMQPLRDCTEKLGHKTKEYAKDEEAIHKNQPPARSQEKTAADNRAAAACRSVAARQGKTTANKHLPAACAEPWKDGS